MPCISQDNSLSAHTVHLVFLNISESFPLLPPPSRLVSRPNSFPLPFQTPAEWKSLAFGTVRETVRVYLKYVCFRFDQISNIVASHEWALTLLQCHQI